MVSLTVPKIDEMSGGWAFSSDDFYSIHFFLTLFSGWFYDWTQTYDTAFYFSGCCVLLGGFVLLLAALPFWDTCNKLLPRPAPTTFLYKVTSNV